MQQRRVEIGWLVMGAAAAGRAALGVAVATAAHATLPATETQAILQILFLQGGLAALLSASAYARAAHIASAGFVGDSVRAFIIFVTATTSASLILGWVVVPDYDLDSFTHAAVVSLMIIGAAATALNAFLQGLLVGGSGKAAMAFWPVVLTSTLATITAIVAHQHLSIVALTLIWVIPQVASPAILALVSPTASTLLRSARRTHTAKSNYFALTGTVNSSSVALAFIFRERWSTSQTHGAAATTFTVVRITEIVYQVASMTLSSLPRVTQRLSIAMFATPARRWIIGALAVAVSLMCFAPALAWDQWTIQRLLVAELLTAPARILAMITALTLLARETTKGYIFGIACTMAAALVAISVPAVQASPFGLHAFQAGGTLPIVFVAALVARNEFRSRDGAGS